MSTVPVGIAAEAHRYLAEGGPANLAQLHAFLSDTVLLTGEGFEPPAGAARLGVPGPADRPAVEPGGDRAADASGSSSTGPTSAAGNTAFVHALADAVEATGAAAACRSSAASLRAAPDDLLDALGTPRRAGRHRARRRRHQAGRPRAPAATTRPGTSERLAALDIPVLQGLCLT